MELFFFYPYPVVMSEEATTQTHKCGNIGRISAWQVPQRRQTSTAIDLQTGNEKNGTDDLYESWQLCGSGCSLSIPPSLPVFAKEGHRIEWRMP